MGADVEGRPLASLDEYEVAARAILGESVYDFIAGGAGEELTLRANREAFANWALRPRVLVDVSARDLGTTVLGQESTMPVFIAPTSLQRLTHPDGELATARAAQRAGTVLVVSSFASMTLEAIAAAAPGGTRWFQLYVHRDRSIAEDLVRRAADAGYTALVLTVDAPVLGIRDRDVRNRFTTPPEVHLANLAVSLPEVEGSGLFAFMAERHDPSVNWRDLEWLRGLSSMPIVLKGVMTAEDARLAVDHGVNAVIVSNHGGRQLDGVSATLDALPQVAETANGRLEVLLDGGIRRGSQVLKALALGARAVLIGRPILWGLAVGGEEGVFEVLDTLRRELDNAAAIAGCPVTRNADRSFVEPGPILRRLP